MGFTISKSIQKMLKGAKESQISVPLYNTQAELQLLSKLKNQSYKAYIGALRQLPTRDISTDLETTSTYDIKREEDKIFVGGLIPTQREIFLDAMIPKTTEEVVAACFEEPAEIAGEPIITFNYTFIIDGHHRWATMCAINPRIKCRVINFIEFNLTPIQFLKLLQGAIVLSEGDLPLTPKGEYDVDIFHASVKLIREYVEENLSPEVLKGIRDNLGLRDLEQAKEYYIQNIISIKYNNIPAVGSPGRELMPQTDPDSTQILDVMKEPPVLNPAQEEVQFWVRRI
jgi:hypothetical protein